jgi:acetyl-CoA synthetase
VNRFPAAAPDSIIPSQAEVVWRPSADLIAQSNLSRFIRTYGLSSLDDLQHRSITNLEWFWNTVLHDLDIRFHRPHSRVIDLGAGIPWAKWCVNGGMNIVANCLDKYAGTTIDARTALRWEGEEGNVRTMTYGELRRDVNRMANALRSLGLPPGSAIGVFMPMTPEIVVAMLAIIKIGAVFLPLFSGFGAEAIISRLQDAKAGALFTADGFWRRAKEVAMKPIADEAAAKVETVRAVIVLRRLGRDVSWHEGRDYWWHDLISNARDDSPTEPTGADDPMMLLYTSGTTGKPKAAVHTHCGFPVKAAQDISQGLDLHPDETLYWVTDMGWMMGPWLVFGTLLLGATMMLYDGAPDYPDSSRVWRLIAKHRITTLGISPTLVRSLRQQGAAQFAHCDLSSLRKFGSTGEPWNADPWMWLFEKAGGGKLPIINYSGGTEISGGILMGNVHKPMKPCAFAGPLPGMAADIVDDAGHSVQQEVGELVLRQPWIGMTRGFWGDPGRYLESYWSRFPGIWVHGDWAARDQDGDWYILGRSDDTIKIAGKRLGPAEVETVLVRHPSLVEAAAIGVPHEVKGEALVCFCVLRPGITPTEILREELKTQVGAALGKALAPKTVKFVRELPKTRNAKVMRRLVRAAYLNEPVGDISALENLTAIDEVLHAT